MTYKELLIQDMKWLSEQEDTIFIGQNIINSGRYQGTLNEVPLNKCIEMPLAENLIVGCAMGLTLKGYRPVIPFLRMDFMLSCADAIINHVAFMHFPVIFRASIGHNQKRFDGGFQQSKDLTHIFEKYLKVVEFGKGICQGVYANNKEPAIIVERRDLYEFET